MISRLMSWLSVVPLRFPWAVVIFSAVVSVAALVFVPRLHVSTDRNILSGKDNAAFRLREEVNDLFGTALPAVVIIKGQDDPSEVRAAADDLAAALHQRPDMIREVFHKADLEFFKRHALLFLPIERLQDNDQSMTIMGEAADVLTTASTLPQLVEGAAGLLDEIPAPENVKNEDSEKALKIAGQGLEQLAAWLTGKQILEGMPMADDLWSLGPALSSKPGADGYLVEKDGKAPHLAVLFVQPTSESQGMEVVAPLTDFIRAKAKEVLASRPGLEAVVTGMPALTTDEMRLVAHDCVLASIVSGLGVLLVFMLMFRSVRVSIFLVLPLGVGLLWSAGFTGLVYGHLTLITSYFAAVLFGLGVAYTIHIVGRFHESLIEGVGRAEAVRASILGAGPGVFVAGTTTALAFFAIAFSEFKGFAEMGIVSGVGTVIVLLTNLTLLPAALLLWHPGVELARRQAGRSRFWVRIEGSRIVVPVVAVGACIAGFILAPKVGFDYAVESMLPEGSEAVRGMRLLDERTEFSTTYSVAVADSLAQAEKLRREFEKLPTVARAEALSMFFPPARAERLKVVRQLEQEIGDKVKAAKLAVEGRATAISRSTAAQVGASLVLLADRLEDLSFDAKRAGRSEAASMQGLVERARSAAERVSQAGVAQRVAELETRVFEGLAEGLRIIDEALRDQGFEMKDIPPAVRGRYLSKDGKSYAVIVFPKGDVGSRDFLNAHVADLKSVSAKTTGHVVTHKEFTRMVLDGFRDAVILSCIAVLILVLLDLRRPKDLALALTPVIIGAGCTALVMYIFDLRFNYANLLAVPILIGTGVDYGAHLAHRAKQEGSLAKAAETTGRAVALTGLTTLIGFGSLCLGNHWGVRSLGILLIVSISFSLFAALIVLPGLVRIKGE